MRSGRSLGWNNIHLLRLSRKKKDDAETGRVNGDATGCASGRAEVGVVVSGFVGMVTSLTIFVVDFTVLILKYTKVMELVNGYVVQMNEHENYLEYGFRCSLSWYRMRNGCYVWWIWYRSLCYNLWPW